MTAIPDAAAPVDSGPRSTFTSTIRLKLKVPARLRNLELVLSLLAIAINIGAIVLVQLGAMGHVGYTVIGLSAILGALVLAMHFTMRIVAPDADPLILPIITVLNG